jgi:CubicO group peptidase (beta-lactamase class C family)
LTLDGLFSLAGGAGCLISTPEDIAKFNQQLFSGQLLQPATLLAMQTDYLQSPSTGLRYGLGVYTLLGFQPYANWGHDGNLIYQSFALYFPGLGISIAVQQNDDRNDSPQTPMNDLVDVFVELFFAYLDYQPMTAVNEPTARPELFLSPNPTEGILNVVWQDAPKSEVTYVLVNALGQVLKTRQFDGQTLQINLSDLPSGVYYLNAQSGSKRYSLPVVRN